MILGNGHPNGQCTACDNCSLRRRLGLREFTSEELAFVRELKADELRVNPGISFLREGTRSDYLYTVLNGWAFRYKMLDDGRRQTLNYALPGDLLGLQGAPVYLTAAIARVPDFRGRRQADIGRTMQVTAAAGLDNVRAEIARACRDAGRDPAEVTLVAVSKTFTAEAIEPVIAAGQRVFGENRVQEAKGKWPPLLARHGDVSLHLIGPLQSNKAKDAVALFDAIHSVDRVSLCEALAREIARQGRKPLLFVEINTGAEPQKAGVLPQDADAFLADCRENHGLEIGGLMCIPPFDDAPGPHFALTAKIARRNGLKLLSMGMSADFATAIQLGATHVRVGSAIFGEREKKT